MVWLAWNVQLGHTTIPLKKNVYESMICVKHGAKLMENVSHVTMVTVTHKKMEKPSMGHVLYGMVVQSLFNTTQTANATQMINYASNVTKTTISVKAENASFYPKDADELRMTLVLSVWWNITLTFRINVNFYPQTASWLMSMVYARNVRLDLCCLRHKMFVSFCLNIATKSQFKVCVFNVARDSISMKMEIVTS